MTLSPIDTIENFDPDAAIAAISPTNLVEGTLKPSVIVPEQQCERAPEYKTRKPLITHSAQDCFKTCRRKFWYAYELGMRPTEDARALRMGSAFHEGIDIIGKGGNTDQACERVYNAYEHMPDGFDAYWWAIERETILRLLCGYAWRWQGTIEYVKTEFAFELPLINPATGSPTNNFRLAGKIDGIIVLEDGRLAVKESKLLGDDIGHDAPLWRRLRMDHQISLYIHAARRMGFACDTVLYDVTRKPSIQPTAVPITDKDGIKIVLDQDGLRVKNATNKAWRQTADKEKGYVLQTRQMTVEEWGDKLTEDIVARPEFYFARNEVPRLDQDVIEAQAELWDIQKSIREAQREGRWYRTVNRNTCQYCPYFDVCSTNQQIDANRLPAGFELLTDVHPELGQ